MSLLKLIAPDVHASVEEQWGQKQVWYRFPIIAVFILCFPCVYAKWVCDKTVNCEELADPQKKGWFGGAIVYAWILLTVALQLGFGPCLMREGRSWCCTSSTRWKISFYFYYVVYKFWQIEVILPYASGLTYANWNLLPCLIPGARNAHVGVFVVGVAVNTLQAIMLGFIVLALQTDNFALVSIVGYGMARLALKLMNFFIAPPEALQALMDLTIVGSPHAQTFFQMQTHSGLALTEEKLDELYTLFDDRFVPRVFPSMTFNMSILLGRRVPEEDGRCEWYVLDLATGQESGHGRGNH